MATRPTSAELLPKLERLLASRITDRELLRGLEVLAQEGPLGELTHRYGPELYARDRTLFSRFIVQRFTTYRVEKHRFVPIKYKAHAARLDPWLEAADQARDVELFRALWSWKYQGDAKRWTTELRGRHARAVTAPERAEVRALFAGLGHGRIDEDMAMELYRDDRAASKFILDHAPMRGWGRSGGRWLRMERLALDAGDVDFERELYRRMVSESELARDLGVIAADPALSGVALADALDLRTPVWPRGFAKVALALLEARGADVVAYLLRHVHHLPLGAMGGTKGDVRTLIERARARGFLDLWARSLQTAASDADYDELIRERLRPTHTDAEALADLARLAGVVSEYNYPGLGIARIRALTDATAVAFHERFPKLLRERWKSSLFVGWHLTYPRLVRRLVEVDDEDLLDFVASRLATRDLRWMPAETQETIELLAAYYEGLSRDEARFAARASQVLSQVPAFAVAGFDRVIHGNRLGRLFFLRRHAALLEDPRGVGDLLEAPNIYVQALAFRALGGRDERAAPIAEAHLRLLLATLLRPLHRKTRVLAFGALANAARTPESAARVLSQCRMALALPEATYPREPLLGLMAGILRNYPELRRPIEIPTIHRLAEASS